MLTSPLEQFTVVPLIPIQIGNLDISFTNSAFFMLLAVTTVIGIITLSTYKSTLVPTRWQGMLEMMYEFVLDMVNDNLGKQGQRYFPFVFSIFTFVLLSNLIGLIPYSFTATSHLIITFALAFTIWSGCIVLAFATHGIRFFGFFFPEGAPIVIAPFIVAIELLSFFSRPLSLSLRLFANMMAGHALFKIMAGFSWTMLKMGGVIYLVGFLPIAFLVILTGLELGVCFIQAYVFAILTIFYINDSLHMH